MNILVTGGAGYIGSHTVVELTKHGHTVTVVDNFSNSSPEVMKRLNLITGLDILFYDIDIRDKKKLREIVTAQKIEAVFHFAGLKAVGESVKKPLEYYSNNIDSSLILCEVMQECGVKKLVFSSSATVYGNPGVVKYEETLPTGQHIASPYGQTKYMIEQILRDVVAADPSWEITSLRHFNPIGAHESGMLGEDPSNTPNNLMPYITQVAVGRLEKLRIFGGDYDTIDGTGVRDYIHVVDLAKGHIAALDHLSSGEMSVYNLGAGSGISVLELVRAFEKASGKVIMYDIIERRAGDLACFYADVTKANTDLGWQTEKTLDDACADSWRWQSINPDGYATSK